MCGIPVVLLKNPPVSEMSSRKRLPANSGGIRVIHIDKQSAAYHAGIRTGDRICSVNNVPVEHELDFSFLTATSRSTIVVRRAGRIRVLVMRRGDGMTTGVEFSPTPIRRCGNRCVFCFIDQLPPGMRRRLYVKDEDCRHSFLNGNYVTLCGARGRELRQIVRFGLSPLYLSVHATEPRVRRAMLRNRRAGSIMRQLVFLERHGIRFHTQIVVCPGLNDGGVLRATLADLCRLRKGMLSCAVVPVGLTRFHRNGLQPISIREAQRIVSQVSRISERDRRACGVRRIFLADELYLKAGVPIPPRSHYGDYPQIENGVGLLRSLLQQWQALKRSLSPPRRTIHLRRPLSRFQPRRYVCVITSKAAFRVIDNIVARLSESFPGVQCRAVAVENRYFGPEVTVAGLLTGRDIVRALRPHYPKPTLVVLPRVVLNHRGYTLDGYSVKRMGREAKLKIRVAADLIELAALVRSLDERCAACYRPLSEHLFSSMRYVARRSVVTQKERGDCR